MRDIPDLVDSGDPRVEAGARALFDYPRRVAAGGMTWGQATEVDRTEARVLAAVVLEAGDALASGGPGGDDRGRTGHPGAFLAALPPPEKDVLEPTPWWITTTLLFLVVPFLAVLAAAAAL